MDKNKDKIFKIKYNNDFTQNGSSLQSESKIELNTHNISNKFKGFANKLKNFKNSINENNKL